MLIQVCSLCGRETESTHPLLIGECVKNVCPLCAISVLNEKKTESQLLKG